MHVIPMGKPAGRLVDLLDGPQLLAATLWGRPTSPEAISQRAVAWMKAVGRPVCDLTLALEAIAWAEGLPSLREILGSEVWQALAECLSGLPVEVDEQTLSDQPLVHQILAGELAWTLASRLPQSPVSRRWERSGQKAISLGLSQILDRQGMPPAKHFRILRPLLACWTRCRALAGRLSHGGLGPRPEQRFRRFVRNALRCTRPDGQTLFAEDELASWPRASWGRELFDAVLKSGVEEIDRRLAATAGYAVPGLPNLSPGSVAKAAKKAADLPPASICCEDSAIAVMRRNWNRDDERIAVLFAGQNCEIELVSCGRLAATGTWRFEITQQGQQLQPVSHWELSCWYSDEDVDYLELEMALTAGVRLQRQIVLAREDRFLFLADAVMGPPPASGCPAGLPSRSGEPSPASRPCKHGARPGDMQYHSVLPLAPQVEFRGAAESYEGFLVQGGAANAGGSSATAARPLAQVLPLGMPEWRAEPHDGDLKSTAEGLELRQSTTGQRLFAPLFIDLDRSRFRRRMTWRQLTVAESLAPVPRDVAVGFRIAIGDRQWIIYRSLAASGNRTLLGHNLATESLIARFGEDGEVTLIVEIE